MLKRITCIVLALLMLVLCAAACAKNDTDNNPGSTTTSANTPSGNDPQGTTNASGNNDAPETTQPQSPQDTTTAADEKDDLPEDVTFGGATYSILTRKATSYEVLSNDITGDPVSDAVYERNTTVEDRFDIKIKVIEEPGEWTDRTTFVQKVQNTFMSGGNDFDLIMTHSAYIVDLGIKGLAYDMSELSEIDLTKRWWCPQYTENVNIDGMIFSAVGDLTYSLYERLQCLYFNKGLAEANSLPDLYAMVENGTWTFDKLKEYSLLVGQDLNGDGIYDKNDLYGLAINNHTCRIFQTVFDTKMTVKGTDGHHTINLPNEKYLNVYDDVYNFIKNNSQVYWQNEADSQVETFMEGHVLFFAGRLGNAVTMKDMQGDYGIIPFPKYDSSQANYISGARDYMTAMAIYGNIKNPEMVGTVTEAMCMYGYQNITPAYYERSLKLKYLSDDTAMRMLDLIRDTLTFDFAMNYTAQLNIIFSTMGDNIKNSVSNMNSLLKAQAKTWTKLLDSLYAEYAKLDK